MVFVVVVSLLVEASPDELARARVLFQSGKTHYHLGNYSEAIRDFAAGYALSPRPEFLVNLAQAYRASGELERAVDLLEKFLAQRPTDSHRGEVVALIDELKLAVAEQEQEQERARRRAALPSDAPTQVETAPVRPAPAAVVAPSERKPSPLVWVVPAGLAVAAGIAIGVVVGVSSQVSCGPERSLGCHDLRTR